MNRRELRNFIQFVIRHPGYIGNIICYYSEKIINRISRRFHWYFRPYPAYIKRYLLQNKHDISTTWHGSGIACEQFSWLALNESVSSVTNVEFDRIQLAYGEVDAAILHGDWELDYDDIEQYYSLHRWNWLLMKLTETPSLRLRHWGLLKIQKWVSRHMKNKLSPAWEPYSTGERIVNILLFCLRVPRKPGEEVLPGWLEAPLEEHARWIVNHLEYYPGGDIGNHVLNNARALYFFGRVYQRSAFEDIGYLIVKNELPRLFTTHGFLREGSSHYHFLIVRWLLEMYWLALHTKDRRMENILAPFLRMGVQRCYFFLVYNHARKDWETSLIGDVSPDFPPEWLMDMPWSAIAQFCFRPSGALPAPNRQGWASLFGYVEKPSRPSTLFSKASNNFYPEDGWLRLELEPFTLFWHIQEGGIPLYSNHAHCDTLSFCCYFYGIPLLVDPGRYSYSSNGKWGVTARCHNSVNIDGLDPFVWSRLFPVSYRKAKVSCKSQLRNDSFSLIITHDGFGRMGNENIQHKRTFNVSRSKIEIQDLYTGNKTHTVETFFQFHPDVEVYKEQSVIRCVINVVGKKRVSFLMASEPPPRELLVIRGETNCEDGWYFPAYGQKKQGTKVIFRGNYRFPMEQSFTFEERC